MYTAKEFALSMNSQLLNPDPPVVANPQFRRALLVAADRKRLADELMYGLSDVADSSISPMEAEYPYVEPGIVRYPFDPARSSQMIEELGYRKGPDGMFQDAGGRPLSVQIMATQDDTNAKPQFAILDAWRSIGITPDAEIVTAQRQRDLAYRANFRSFSLQAGISSGADGVSALLTREARTAERNYLGRNYTRHSNPEIDSLVDRYFTTIPFDERMGILSEIIHYTTDNLVWMPLYWRVLPTLMHNRVVDVSPYGNGDQFRNAQEWSVSS
jgi:peptide/nickel transport system substrate-binding protein